MTDARGTCGPFHSRTFKRSETFEVVDVAITFAHFTQALVHQKGLPLLFQRDFEEPQHFENVVCLLVPW